MYADSTARQRKCNETEVTRREIELADVDFGPCCDIAAFNIRFVRVRRYFEPRGGERNLATSG